MRLSQHLCSEGTGKGIFETWQYLIIYFLDCFDSQHLYWNEVWVYIGEKKLTSDTSQARKDLNLTVSSSTRMAFTTDRTIPTPHTWPFTFHYKLQKPSCGAGDLMRLMDPASETWVAFTSMNINSTGLSLLSIELLVGCPIGILNLNKNLSWNKRSNTVHHEVLQKPSSTLGRFTSRHWRRSGDQKKCLHSSTSWTFQCKGTSCICGCIYNNCGSLCSWAACALSIDCKT